MIVAQLPFKPLPYLASIISYNVDTKKVDEGVQPVGAPFLFIVAFLTMKVIIRKLMFRPNKVQLKIKGLSEYRVAVPRKMLFDDSLIASSNNSTFWALIQSVFQVIFTIYSSLLPLYQALKKYNSIKYTISISRAVSRLTGFIC